jgi:hypothetical protein
MEPKDLPEQTQDALQMLGKGYDKSNDAWAIAELMGHLTLAGRVTKPGEYGGLWQIDIPEDGTFRTEFFGSQSVYRIRMVSEEIARAYAKPNHDIIEYDAPIVTRAEHENAMMRAREALSNAERQNEELRRRLTAVNALPEPYVTVAEEQSCDHEWDTDETGLFCIRCGERKE